MVNIAEELISAYEEVSTSLQLPYEVKEVILVVLFAIGIVLVSLFIFKFYKTISKRDLIELNLVKYNWSEHPLARKFWATILYLIEYILVMPFILLLWFFAMAIIVLMIADQKSTIDVLMITASMVAAVRMLSYYGKEIAIDVAKLFPFISLGVFILSPGGFSIPKIIGQLNEFQNLLDNVIYYLVAMVIIEITLRLIYTLTIFAKSSPDSLNNRINELREKEED
jgi:hypothetical protein